MFGYHDTTLAEAFADVAAAHADTPAVLTQDVAITYAELAARAGGVARRLRESGDIGDRVGLRLDHGIDMISGMLGALAAGRIYVPLDPTYPSARLTQMREQADIDTVLDSLDDIAPAPFEVTTVAPTDPAYILFTSGSTGRPKGVTHTHRSVLHGIANHVDNLSIGPGDRLSLLTSFSFDMSVSDLYAAVLSGATVVTFDLRRHGFARLAEVLVDRAVTVYHSTPTVFRYLVDVLGPRRLPSIRVVVLGGEQVDRSDLRQVRERCARDCVLVNGYGATEASFAIQNHLRASDPEPVYAGEVVPIGSPLRGYTIRLVDPEDRTVDLTALDDDTEPSTGEIAIVSDYLASGYWGDPEQTAARFDASGRVYRTGDLATRLPDGTLLYLGRSDRQVKVRGHRLELAEVEAQLQALPEVARAVAVARPASHGGTEIIGYVQRRSGTSDAAVRALDAARLRGRLRDRVPDFMVPRTLVVVDRFVLTPTGKVDHAALPEPTVDDADPVLSPADATAGLVARAWHAALGVPSIETDVNFFDAGGDSLALARLQRELARLGHDVDLQVLLAHPTIEDLADLLDASPVTGGPGSTPPASPRVASWGRASRERQGDEIAIIGMAGRFPGCPDVPTLWRRLLDAADCTSGAPVPVEEFDAEFFGIDPDEAARWDPQHRLFLETAWEALEAAGYDPTRLSSAPEDSIGSVGVFGSASENRYLLHVLLPLLGEIPVHHAADYLPTQVAYRLGTTGPTMAVQTGCSGSLVAVCTAATALADYRCDLAIAGGANVIVPGVPGGSPALSSPDGLCRAFDAQAEGTGFGSGVGAVVLRRLADAEADGDHVHAVIRGWAVTNDGSRRAGFAAPGVDGQAAAVEEALAVAGLTPGDVGYVEGHGSGTLLGDAVEVTALRSVYGDQPHRIALGSIKTNIGHLDAASGIAGLLKAASSVEHGQIPANLHFTEPNPQVDFGPFFVPTKTTPWHPTSGERVAGVSAFGLGGTNAHVVVSEPPAPEEAGRSWSRSPVHGPIVLPLSARTPSALRSLADRLRRHLVAERPSLVDVAYTLAVGRTRFAHRTAITCRDLDEAVDRLGAIASGAPGETVDWDRLDPPQGRRLPLPTYPFERRRCWIDRPEGAS